MGYSPPHLNIRKVTGGWSASSPGVTTEDLFIYGNSIDTRPYIQLLGNDYIFYDIANGNTHQLAVGGEIVLMVGGNTGTTNCDLTTLNNRNIGLFPNGTGKVKFGTYAAGAGETFGGTISILDAAGTARKLAVFA